MRGKRLVFAIIDSNTTNNVQKSPFSLTGQRGEITAGVLLIFFFFYLIESLMFFAMHLLWHV